MRLIIVMQLLNILCELAQSYYTQKTFCDILVVIFHYVQCPCILCDNYSYFISYDQKRFAQNHFLLHPLFRISMKKSHFITYL